MEQVKRHRGSRRAIRGGSMVLNADLFRVPNRPLVTASPTLEAQNGFTVFSGRPSYPSRFL